MYDICCQMLMIILSSEHLKHTAYPSIQKVKFDLARLAMYTLKEKYIAYILTVLQSYNLYTFVN